MTKYKSTAQLSREGFVRPTELTRLFPGITRSDLNTLIYRESPFRRQLEAVDALIYQKSKCYVHLEVFEHLLDQRSKKKEEEENRRLEILHMWEEKNKANDNNVEGSPLPPPVVNISPELIQDEVWGDYIALVGNFSLPLFHVKDLISDVTNADIKGCKKTCKKKRK